MRWYVSRAGETVGPLEEDEMRRRAKASALDGAQVRDEAGGAWVAAEKSPFGALMKERGMVAPIVVGLLLSAVGVFFVGLLGLVAGLVGFSALALYRRI